MPAKRRSAAPGRSPRSEKSTALAEEIQRIQALLRRLDGALEDKEEVSLRELAQAVRTAGDGGRSIAQLRKLEKELESAMQDQDAERLRASLFEMIERLRRRRQHNPPDGL